MAHLIYIHGFNSSDKSQKAEIIQKRCEQLHCADAFISPCLSWEPKQAIFELETLIEDKLQSGAVTLCGSSLGGFYATYLSQKYAIKSILVNPAVAVYELFEQHLGQQYNPYTDEKYVLTDRHRQQLLEIEVDIIDAKLFWLLLQEGDETLDFRQSLQKYPTVKTVLETQGSHRFDGFERFVDEILIYSNLLPDQ